MALLWKKYLPKGETLSAERIFKLKQDNGAEVWYNNLKWGGVLVKKIRDIAIAVIAFAIICFVFWRVAWISSWKEVAFLYAILAIVIAAGIITDTIKKRFGK